MQQPGQGGPALPTLRKAACCRTLPCFPLLPAAAKTKAEAAAEVAAKPKDKFEVQVCAAGVRSVGAEAPSRMTRLQA